MAQVIVRQYNSVLQVPFVGVSADALKESRLVRAGMGLQPRAHPGCGIPRLLCLTAGWRSRVRVLGYSFADVVGNSQFVELLVGSGRSVEPRVEAFRRQVVALKLECACQEALCRGPTVAKAVVDQCKVGPLLGECVEQGGHVLVRRPLVDCVCPEVTVTSECTRWLTPSQMTPDLRRSYRLRIEFPKHRGGQFVVHIVQAAPLNVPEDILQLAGPGGRVGALADEGVECRPSDLSPPSLRAEDRPDRLHQRGHRAAVLEDTKQELDRQLVNTGLRCGLQLFT